MQVDPFAPSRFSQGFYVGKRPSRFEQTWNRALEAVRRENGIYDLRPSKELPPNPTCEEEREHELYRLTLERLRKNESRSKSLWDASVADARVVLGMDESLFPLKVLPANPAKDQVRAHGLYLLALEKMKMGGKSSKSRGKKRSGSGL